MKVDAILPTQPSWSLMQTSTTRDCHSTNVHAATRAHGRGQDRIPPTPPAICASLSMTAERQRSGTFDTTRNLRRTNFRSKVNRSEEGGDLGSELFGRDLRAEPSDDVALTVDEELLKVPRNSGTVTLLRLHPGVQIAGTVAVDFNLGKHRERRVVLRRGELEDLGVGARLL